MFVTKDLEKNRETLVNPHKNPGNPKPFVLNWSPIPSPDPICSGQVALLDMCNVFKDECQRSGSRGRELWLKTPPQVWGSDLAMATMIAPHLGGFLFAKVRYEVAELSDMIPD